MAELAQVPAAPAAPAAPADRARRTVVSPEGVAFPVELAGRGERFVAFLIDAAIIGAAIVVLALLTFFALGPWLAPGWLDAFVLLASFLLRSFYFMAFELRWRGATPGKRALGLRVIDNAGGALRTDAVVVRNLTREAEIFLPLSLVGAADTVDVGGWIVALTLLWVLVLAAWPLFNRDRMRVGDMIGGSWVINAPKATLLRDLVDAPSPASQATTAAAPAYAFTDRQLDVYGIYELQVLEDVLRQSGPQARASQREVYDRISRRIDWQPPTDKPVNAQAFLQAFYTAQRARLESQMLLGNRRARKRPKTPPR